MASNYKRLKINLSNLLVNLENPRFDAVDSQNEAIKTMVENQEEKLVKLAEDIVVAGLNPTDPIVVTPDPDNNGRYIVREGNRRVTALKILFHPDMLEGWNIPKSRLKKFKELSEQFNISAFNDIECIVFEDNDEYVNKWIQLKHTGENEGVGIVRWDGTQTARFRHMMGIKQLPLQLLDFLKNKLKEDEIRKMIDSIPITNLQRLLNDPQVRSFLGINIDENGDLKVNDIKTDTLEKLKIIIRDLASGNIKVSDIYNKDKRAEYIIRVKERVFDAVEDDLKNKKDLNLINTDTKVVQNNEMKQNHVIETKYRSLPSSTFRKSLIPNTCKIKIRHPRLNKIYKELKSIPVDKYPNAVAVLFRVFFELSLDYFIEQKKLNVKIQDELHKKVTAFENYMLDNNILDNKEIKPLQILVSQPRDITSLNTFNAYVHNLNLQPVPDNLKVSWDNIEHIIVTLWEHVT